MRLLTPRLEFLYRDAIPERFKFRPVAISASIIGILSAAAAAILGKISLIILPGILLVYGAFRYRMFILYIYLASFPVTSYFLGGIHRIINYSLVLLIIAFWIARKLMRAEEEVHLSKAITGFIIAFTLALLLCSLDKGLTGVEVLSLARFIIFFSLAIILYDMYEPRYTIPLIVSISIPFLISAYFTFSKFLQVSGLVDFLNLYRMKPAGIFSNANGFGGRLLFAVPFWTALALWSSKKRLKIISAAMAAILTVALILTNSRSAIVGLGAMCLFYFILAKKLRYFIALVAVAGIIFLSSPTLKTVVSAGLRVERGTSTRDVIWKNSLDIIKNNFWFGIGVGNFTRAYSTYLDTAFEKAFMGDVAVHAHNEILNKTVEMGVLGLFLILAMYYYPGRQGIFLLKKPYSGNDRAIIYGLTGILVANYARSFFEANTFISSGGFYPPILFWLTCIMIIKLNQRYEFGPDRSVFGRH